LVALNHTTNNINLAAAAYAEKLRNSGSLNGFNWRQITPLSESAKGEDK
jgi:ABC-type enterobactin transport system permease subunit